jgi:hypothetical protein
MIRRSDYTWADAGGTPEPGVYITVKTATGALATLYNDNGTSLSNPFQSGALGAFVYNVVDAGVYTEEYRLSLADSPRKVLEIDLSLSGLDGLFVNASSLIVPVGSDMVSTTGYSALGVGSADYIYDAAVDAAYVVANPLSSFISANSRGFRLDHEQGAIPQMLGAVADGTTDCRASIAATDALGSFDLVAGDHLIGSSITISNEVSFLPGAKLIIPNGVTVTFSKQIWAGLEQIFACTGTGNVVFSNPHLVNEVNPEWWGCTVNDATADCLPALLASVAAHPLVQLQLADYYADDTFLIPQAYRKVRGKGIHWGGAAGRMTRLIVKSAASYGVILGPISPPLTGGGAVDINALNLDMLFEDIEVTRTVAPSIAGNSIGVLVSYCQDAVVRRTKSQDHMVQFATVGSINTDFDDIRPVRATAGSGAGTDYSIAVRYITDTLPLTTINGNASCWLRAVAYCNPSISNSEGLRLDANFCDTFIEKLETAGVRTPVRIIGDADTHDDSNPALRTNSNVQIDKLVLDQFGLAGVRIEKLNKYGHVRIGDIYAAPSSGATAAIYITDCKGSITFECGELAMFNSTSVPAVLATNSKNLQILEGVSIFDGGGGVVTLTDVSDSRITCSFRNEFVAASQAILATGTCAGNYYAPKVSGKAGGCITAIAMTGAGHTRNTADVSAISSVAASTAKLNCNGSNITTAGVFATSNLAQGNFA